MLRYHRLLQGFGLLLLSGFAAVAAPKPAPLEFERDVRPILSRYCFKCHGPDDKARKANLRLDVRDSATHPAKSGERAIVPGKPAESELVKRLFATDEDDVMPPPSTKFTLTPEQKDVLKRWVASGAEYQEHWAFVRPVQAALPKVGEKRWPVNPIDNFVLARIEAAGLKPSPEADRYTLVRRLYLDLIGLPPTPEEADAFVKDRRPDAYERLVDRLLESPHYGERWARRWLDLARYADTNGYEKDRQRSIWPYRDWVINALNADMPFDEFTIEQLAGDLLPHATTQQIVATGFHRNTMLNEEGGIDPLEYRFAAMTDRVATTGTTWLGLTIGCAQCHTHKYDPIPHREYYQFMAFFNNADEPEIELPNADITQRRAALQRQIDERIAGLADKFPIATNTNTVATADARPLEVQRKEQLEEHFHQWLQEERARTVAWTVLTPSVAKSDLPLLTIQPDGSILASGDIEKTVNYFITYSNAPRGITAVRLEALPDDSLPNHGPGLTYYEGPKGDFFLSEFMLQAGDAPVKFAKATSSYSKLGIGGGKSGADQAIDGNQQTGWSTSGREGEAHQAVFNLAQPLAKAGPLQFHLLFERHYAAPLGRFRISVTTDPRAAVARDLTADIESLLLLPDASLTPEQREHLRHQFLLSTPALATARAEIDALRKQMPAYPKSLVFRERPINNPRPTFIHNRGEFLQPTDRVEPGVLTMLQPLPKDAPHNRLGFARWLVAPENPLTARVTVNRQWAAFFGRGIVRTTEDFGFQGDSPTHPELLDWLAVEFVKEGWSLKKLHKLIVMSATYRQSSRVTPERTAKDPENRLYSRGPRLRLEAELVRDSALRAAGLLTEAIGGPSVFPPQPAGVTTEGAYGVLEWKVSTGADRYRRGLYTFSKRTTPYAMYTTFDAPSGEACVARRDVSNTPLQALTLLNDTVFVEAAQAFGRTMAVQPGTVEERVQSLFRRCFVRPATAKEIAALVQFYNAQKLRLTAGELDAQKLAGEGTGDAVERAAWTVLARALLNLDEMITRG